MTSEPDYNLRHDRSHACAVPWSDGGTDAHWRCPECGRWWERTWGLAGDQPPVDYGLLALRAGIPRGEIELIVYLHGGGDGGGHPSCAARGGLPKQIAIYHGAQDTAVPPAQAKAFSDSLEAAGGYKVNLQIVDGLGHQIPWVHHRSLIEALANTAVGGKPVED